MGIVNPQPHAPAMTALLIERGLPCLRPECSCVKGA